MRGRFVPVLALVLATLATACSGDRSGPQPAEAGVAGAGSAVPKGVHFAAGLEASIVAHVGGARELAALPNGDLLVGTTGHEIAIVPGADGPAAPGAPQTFMTLPEGPAAGVAYGPGGSIYAATNTTVWKTEYRPGDRSEPAPSAVARVRTGPIAPHSDGDVHQTTSVAVSDAALYVGVGSSCNACVEVDPTRATVLRMQLDGSHVVRLAKRTRNPIALALDPHGTLWIGGAGQDRLPFGHPFEYMDAPARHAMADVDYGWPDCDEDRHPYNALHLVPAPSCAAVAVPAVAFPAYATLVGAAFYPSAPTGAHAFPASYRGGLFVTSHGSWHCCPSTPPRVYFVPMHDGAPSTPVNWNDPSTQSRPVAWGFGSAQSQEYGGRPTGIAVGASGSVFFADDLTGNIYRLRPT